MAWRGWCGVVRVVWRGEGVAWQDMISCHETSCDAMGRGETQAPPHHPRNSGEGTAGQGSGVERRRGGGQEVARSVAKRAQLPKLAVEVEARNVCGGEVGNGEREARKGAAVAWREAAQSGRRCGGWR